ncbi:MAG TPA: choice-of-anchor D domain-containing protein, partial [Terriglobales bacterium]|nr:choice-of-anchor D domain-containing protein [Terriglobales bacterium]
WVNISWGPLALMGPTGMGTGTTADTFLGNYVPTGTSPTRNFIPANATNTGTNGAYTLAPGLDFCGNVRKDGNVDAGAVEFGATPPVAILAVTGGPLNFGNVAVTTPSTTSSARTLTLTNSGLATAVEISLNFSSTVFSRPAGAAGGTCGTTLAAGANCTINVVFAPTAVGAANGTLTITANVAVTGSPVSLSGTGLAIGQLSYTAATNGTLGTLLGVRTLTFTIPSPRAAVTSVVTITNTGSAPLNITAETITAGAARFSVTGTTCSFTVPLAINGNCTMSVQYATPAARPFFPNIGSVRVNNNGAGTTGGGTTLGLLGQ